MSVTRDTEFPQVARNVRLARRAAGHTQESLARELGVTLRAVQTWEGGTSYPSRQSLVALARVLRRGPEWFYGVDHQQRESVAYIDFTNVRGTLSPVANPPQQPSPPAHPLVAAAPPSKDPA